MTRSEALALDAVTVLRGPPGRETTVALGPIDLRVTAGAHVSIVGPNGAGKTSLLLALVGAAPIRGVLSVGGEILERKSLAHIRARVALVFAEPADQLFTDSVFDEVAFGPRQDGMPADEIRRRVTRALTAVGLSVDDHRHPHALSLGQQRRLAIAAALARDVSVVLCDEPTAGLDPVARRAVLAVLADLHATVVMATHDLDAARRCTTETVLLRDGSLVANGPTSLLDDAHLLERAGLA